jgi:cardiolipin synthase
MSWFLTVYITIGWGVRLTMVLVVLRRSFAPGAAIAWLGIVFIHPYIGLALYLSVGESRLGPGRVARHHRLVERYALIEASTDLPNGIADSTLAFSRLAAKVGRMPVVGGNRVEFFTNPAEMVSRLAADIESATASVHLLYYILADDATGRQIIVALKKATGRGVTCRVILDAFASRHAFGRNGFAAELKASNVEVIPALPTSTLRRRDLRNHRKLAVIDNQCAYSGSMNLINPDYNGRRGGPWVDLSARFQGPVVAEFAAVFAGDWAFETDQLLDVPAPGSITPFETGTPMQLAPTGPASPGENYRRILLGAVTSAQKQLTLTTPYFIPDDATLVAMQIAADRGVAVTLIVPLISDNQLAAAAGRAQYARLLDSGIRIFQYRPGLIHTKLVTVDDTVAVFGSANLDVRSFHLNFELSTLLFGPQATNQLYEIQQAYIASSIQLQHSEWDKRSILRKYADSAISLFSPLL